MLLVWPASRYLGEYTNALERGWSPDNLRPEAAQEELARIAADPDRFLAEHAAPVSSDGSFPRHASRTV